MKIKNHTPIALFVGLQACIIQIIDQSIHSMFPPEGNGGFAWVSFLAWATYFMAGCTIKDGVRSFIGFVIGMIAGIVIILLSSPFSSLGFFATPLAILIIATLLFYLEIAPHMFSFVPSVYIACGAYFGCMTYVPEATFSSIFIAELSYLSLGLFFGWMTIAFKTWYETRSSVEKVLD